VAATSRVGARPRRDERAVLEAERDHLRRVRARGRDLARAAPRPGVHAAPIRAGRHDPRRRGRRSAPARSATRCSATAIPRCASTATPPCERVTVVKGRATRRRSPASSSSPTCTCGAARMGHRREPRLAPAGSQARAALSHSPANRPRFARRPARYARPPCRPRACASFTSPSSSRAAPGLRPRALARRSSRGLTVAIVALPLAMALAIASGTDAGEGACTPRSSRVS
jgi:hypothetical protein